MKPKLTYKDYIMLIIGAIVLPLWLMGLYQFVTEEMDAQNDYLRIEQHLQQHAK